jgi:GT2 family glycosyltransferase
MAMPRLVSKHGEGRTTAGDIRVSSSAQGASDISAIIPVYNGETTLQRSLEPLLAMRTRGEIAEIIVVDDGSTDATAAIAGALGVRVMDSGGRVGPGGARNVAASTAVGNVLWFVDADVVVHADAARVLAEALQRTGAAAVFGSYDDDPPASGFLSLYKNLVHAYYHRREQGTADTFWAGCGAVRKQAFLDVGGFDGMRYRQPSIEDIELGWRLRQRGLAIQIVPALQAKHLKIWRLKSLLRTEIFQRAVPWSRLIHEHGVVADTLNISREERLRALLVVCCLGTIILAAAGWTPAWLPAAMLGGVAIANRRLFDFFRRRRGAMFALGAVAFHQAYYLYSTATFAWCWFEHRWSVARLALKRSATR